MALECESSREEIVGTVDLIVCSRRGTNQHLSVSRRYHKNRKFKITVLNKDAELCVYVFSKMFLSVLPKVIHHCYRLSGKQDMDKGGRSPRISG